VQISFVLILGLCLVVGGCNSDATKVAQFDQEKGAVKGTIKSVPKGTMVVLCLAEKTGCTPMPELYDIVNRKGKYVVSMVPPGHYVIAYIYPKDLIQGKPNIKQGEILNYTFGSNIKIEAKMKDGNWCLDKDTSSDTHLIAAGATLDFGSPGRLSIKNCSVKHKATGFWMEYRDGHRYESVEIQPNKVVELIITRWSSD